MAQSEGNDKNAFRPYVSAGETIAEVTIRAIILGSILSVVFGVANAYIGLKYGMTVSASIPAAVMSMAILIVKIPAVFLVLAVVKN